MVFVLVATLIGGQIAFTKCLNASIDEILPNKCETIATLCTNFISHVVSWMSSQHSVRGCLEPALTHRNLIMMHINEKKFGYLRPSDPLTHEPHPLHSTR